MANERMEFSHSALLQSIKFVDTATPSPDSIKQLRPTRVPCVVVFALYFQTQKNTQKPMARISFSLSLSEIRNSLSPSGCQNNVAHQEERKDFIEIGTEEKK